MMARLGEVFNLQMGKTPSRNKSDYWVDCQYSWVSIADLSSYQKYVGTTKEKISAAAVQESGIKRVPANTVIMSFKLSLGKTAITQEPVYTNEAIMAFIPTGKYEVLPDYFYHLFSAKDWTKGTNRAVMGTTLNKATLDSISITVPSLDEQRKIAAELDQISTLIDKRCQQLEKLDLLVKAKFVEMFGDPVENSYNWKIHKLSELGDCKNGMNFHTNDVGTEIHCLGVGDFKNLSCITDTSSLSTIVLKDMPSSEYILNDGDIVFVRSNGNKALVGRSLVVYPSMTTTFSGFCIRFRLNLDNIKVDYLLQVLKADSIRKKMTGRGANIQNLNQKILGELEIPVPPLELQNQFSVFYEQTEKTRNTISRSLEKLETLKKAQMQKYFG